MQSGAGSHRIAQAACPPFSGDLRLTLPSAPPALSRGRQPVWFNDAVERNVSSFSHMSLWQRYNTVPARVEYATLEIGSS